MKILVKMSFFTLLVCILFFSSLTEASLPDPLIYLSFDNTWDNQGTASPDTATEAEDPNYRHYPKFSSQQDGVSREALDYTDVNHWNETKLGALGYGNFTPEDPCDDTPMQAALNGLVSFTITGWYNTVDKGVPPSGTPFVYRAANEVNESPFGRGLVLQFQGGIINVGLILNMNNIWADSTSNWVYWAEDQWAFFAVSYDGTQDVNNVVYYKGIYRTPGDISVTGVATLVDGTGHGFATPELHTKVYFFSDGCYHSAGAGLFDELRIFGSKTDASGALTFAQIQEVHAHAFEFETCGDELHPDYAIYDMDGDCVVDHNEITILSDNWLTDNRP